MPIVVACPKCSTKLSAPDNAAGRQVRCPRPGCGAVADVPAFVAAEEVEVVDAAPAPRPKPKPARAEADDEDDRPRSKRRDEDDEEERPRRKRRRDDDDDDYEFDHPRRRRRRKSGGAAAVVIAAVVLGGLVLLAGIGFGIYYLVAKVNKTAPPPGWKEFTYKADNFKAYFPKEPQVFGGGDLAGAGPRNTIPGLGANPVDSFTIYTCGDFNDPLLIHVQVARFPSGLPASVRNELDRGMRDLGNFSGQVAGAGIETRTVRWLGEKAIEVVTPAGVMRLAVTDKAMYYVMIAGLNGTRAKTSDETAFFDNFELLK
jgi:hypothetical protein